MSMARHPLAYEVAACRHIWISVILQCARDMFFVRVPGRRYMGRGSSDTAQARAWLGTRDFHMVCSLAGLDGAKVEAQLRTQLARADAGELDIKAMQLGRTGAAMHKRRLAHEQEVAHGDLG